MTARIGTILMIKAVYDLKTLQLLGVYETTGDLEASIQGSGVGNAEVKGDIPADGFVNPKNYSVLINPEGSISIIDNTGGI